MAVRSRHCVVECEKRQAEGVIKHDLDGRVNWREHCVECSKTDVSSTYVATIVFTATVKNEEAKFYVGCRTVQQSSRIQQNAQTILLYKCLSI